MTLMSISSLNLNRCGAARSAVKFPDVAGSVIQLLMDFLGDTSTASALDVIFFVREIVETNEKLRPAVLARLLDSFTQIRSSRVRDRNKRDVNNCVGKGFLISQAR